MIKLKEDGMESCMCAVAIVSFVLFIVQIEIETFEWRLRLA